MIQAGLRLIEHWFGEALIPLAFALHLGALAVALTGWGEPLAKWAWRRTKILPARGPLTWTCARCGKANPATLLACGACDRDKTWRAAPWVAKTVRAWGLTAFSARVAYEVLFFVTTFLMVYRFRLFTFDHRPLEQLLAAAALLVWMAALHFFRRVFTGGSGLIGRFQDAGASLAFATLFIAVTSLWAASPFAYGRPLAAFSVTPDGAMRLSHRPDKRASLAVDPSDGQIIVAAQYARLTWPVLMVDQTFVLRVGTEAVSRRGTRRLAVLLAKRWTDDVPYKPRLLVTTQVLRVQPPGSYEIHKAQTGEGLVARPAAAPSV